MKATVEVKDRAEGKVVAKALEDPEMKALVLISGAIEQVQGPEGRARVLAWVTSRYGNVIP